MNPYEDVEKFYRIMRIHQKMLSNRIDFDNDSECSSEKEQREIKQEIERNGCNTSPNY